MQRPDELAVTADNLLARLNRIPITRTIVVIMVLLFLAWTVESFDIGVVGTVVLTLTKLWHLTPSQEGWLGASSTLGIVLGLIPAGRLADRFGRRRMLMIGIAVFATFTLLGSLATNLTEMVVLRAIAGLGEGAVFPIPYLLLSEFVHMKKRGASIGWVNGVLTAAYVLPTWVGAWAVSTFPVDVAWHVPFLLGGIPLVLLIPLALWLPESPRYLIQQGRLDPVQALVERLEREAGLFADYTLTEAAPVQARPTDADAATRYHLLRRPYFGRLWLSGIGFGGSLLIFYTTLVYVPSIFHADGMGQATSLLLTGAMMLLAGFATVFQGYAMDRWGRKPVYMTCILIASVGLVWLGFSHTLAAVIVPGLIVALFGVGINFLNKVYMAEQFPTAMRGTGCASGETIARFGSGVVAIYLIPLVLKHGGPVTLFTLTAIVVVLTMVPTWIWGRETAFLNLEQSGAVDASIVSAS
jgi:putative MFS transporter